MIRERDNNLIEALLDRELTPAEQLELQQALRESPAARQHYWQSLMQDRLLRDLLRETRGHDMALVEAATDEQPEAALVAPQQSRINPGKSLVRSMVMGVLAASVLIGLFAWTKSAANLAAPLGKLQSLSGQVTIRDADGRLTPAASGTIVRYGQSILVESEESSAELQLDDGSTLLVEADSVLVLPSSAAAMAGAREHARARFFLERGGLTVQANFQSTQQPLLFTTAQALIKVLGTEFRLYSDAHESRLELNEGSVQLLRQADQQEIVVSAGEYATIPTILVNQKLELLEAKTLSRAKCELRQTLLRAGRSARLSSDSQLMATVRGRELRLWELVSGKVVKQVSQLNTPPEQLAFTPDNQAIVGITQKGQLLQWSLDQTQPRLSQLSDESIRMTHLAADGSAVAQAIAVKPARLQIWRMNENAPEAPSRQTFPAKPWSAAVSPASQIQTAASAQWDGDIELFDLNSGKLLETWHVAKSARPVEISQHSRYLAAYGHEDGLYLFERKSDSAKVSKPGRSLWSHIGARVRCLKFSRDEKLILAGFDDGLVRVWSTQSGEMLLVLQTGDPRVYDLDLSQDGKTLVTVGQNDAVKVWDCVWPELLEGV